MILLRALLAIFLAVTFGCNSKCDAFGFMGFGNPIYHPASAMNRDLFNGLNVNPGFPDQNAMLAERNNMNNNDDDDDDEDDDDNINQLDQQNRQPFNVPNTYNGPAPPMFQAPPPNLMPQQNEMNRNPIFQAEPQNNIQQGAPNQIDMARNEQYMRGEADSNPERVLKLNTNQRIRFVDDIHAYNGRSQPNSESIIPTGGHQKVRFVDNIHAYNNRDQSRSLSINKPSVSDTEKKDEDLAEVLTKVLKFEQALSRKAANNNPEQIGKAKEILKETRAIKLSLVKKMQSQIDSAVANHLKHRAHLYPSTNQVAEQHKLADSSHIEGVVNLSTNNRRTSSTTSDKVEANTQKETINELLKSEKIENSEKKENSEKIVTLAHRKAHGRIKLN